MRGSAATRAAVAAWVLCFATRAEAQSRRRSTRWRALFTATVDIGFGSTLGYAANMPRMMLNGAFGARVSPRVSFGVRVNGSGIVLPECYGSCAPLAHIGAGGYVSYHLRAGRRRRGVPSWEPVFTGGVGYAAVSGWGTAVAPSGAVDLLLAASLLFRTSSEVMVGPFLTLDVMAATVGPRDVPVYTVLQGGVRIVYFDAPPRARRTSRRPTAR